MLDQARSIAEMQGIFLMMPRRITSVSSLL